MKTVYMGTPDFAVPPLKALVEAGYEVAAVVTQPDKPKGRGKTLMPTPVKEEALIRTLLLLLRLVRSFRKRSWSFRSLDVLIFTHHFCRSTEELHPSSRL